MTADPNSSVLLAPRDLYDFDIVPCRVSSPDFNGRHNLIPFSFVVSAEYMRKLLVYLVTLFSLHGRVLANTEKVIFVAPPAPLEPLEYHRALATLTPSNPVARKIQVQLSFEAPTETFFALESLDIGRKYEVRVCWPAMVFIP